MFAALFGFCSVSLAKCKVWEWMCDIGYGIKMAESEGLNGVMISGYAYHLTGPTHWPTGYANGANELVLGAGYSRSYYNHKYNSEYSLFILGFADSFWKPELHVGYTYQKYFHFGETNWKWGIGYSPFVFVKPSLTSDAPLPLPGAGISTSVQYKHFTLMLTYANQLYLIMLD